MLNIISHFYELRIRLGYLGFSFFFSILCAYLNGDLILYFFAKPFLVEQTNKIFIFTFLTEGFLSFLISSFFCGFFMTFPFSFYLIFEFLKLGFFRKEKFVVCSLMKYSASLMFFSFFFMYQIFFPVAINFCLSFEQANAASCFQLYLQPKIFDYIVLNISFFITFLLLFQFPIFINILLYSNVISLYFMFKNRRIFILIFSVIGCIFSPPDMFSQILIAIPLYVLFELILYYQILLHYYRFLRIEGWLGR